VTLHDATAARTFVGFIHLFSSSGTVHFYAFNESFLACAGYRRHTPTHDSLLSS